MFVAQVFRRGTLHRHLFVCLRSSYADLDGCLTIILNEAPYGSEKSWNGLRLASTCASEGMTVNVFLMGDSVTAAKAGQSTPEGYYNMAKMLESLIGRGGRCEGLRCMHRRPGAEGRGVR